MKIILSGVGGLIGNQLIAQLQERGAELIRLVRPTSNRKENDLTTRTWNPGKGELDPAILEGCEAVIHLGGENIASGRWTDAKKKRILDSRIQTTTLLAETMAQCRQPPKHFLCASAMGFYGDRGAEICRETDPPGQGFLPEVCVAWEQSCKAAVAAGVRVVNMRIAMVLSTEGGALEKMMTPFKMGVGGKVGSGRQYWSWISIEDVVHALLFCLDHPEISGPVNFASPQPVTNQTFTNILGEVIHRPTILPLPGFAAKLALGDMADDLLLSSIRVEPTVLKNAAYPFRDAELKPALQRLLNEH